MSSVDKIREILEVRPGLKASTIAKELDSERRDVNQILYGNCEVFVKEADDKWRILEPDKTESLKRRPGPFGPARELIPKNQFLEIISAGEPCFAALEVMEENNYANLPVRNAEGRVIGVFTWKQFASKISSYSQTKVSVNKILCMDVEEFMESVDFLDPDHYIDTTVDWSDVDYVIVGTPDEPLGILTVSDVWAKLNDFGEAYVLLFEIEHDLRQFITTVAGDDLNEWIEKMPIKPGSPHPKSLKDFTFDLYGQLICEKSTRWPRFEPLLHKDRELFIAEINGVRDLRNEVMHFRSRASVQRCNQLRQFRDHIRRAIDRSARAE